MYVVVITSNSCDPFTKGLFKNEKSAEKSLKKYQSTWDENDWYKLEGHVLKINAQTIKYRVHGANGHIFIYGFAPTIRNHSECVYINT